MNSENKILLNWKPIQHFEKLPKVDRLHKFGKENRAGLYVWGFMDDSSKFWPYYAGKHRNVPFRLCEHLSNLKGGNYTVYGIDDLFVFEDKRFYAPHKLTDRIQFIKDDYQRKQIENVRNMINRFHFTYCIMDNFNEFGGMAESTVLNALPSEILINTRIGRSSEIIDIGNLFDAGMIPYEWDNRNDKQADKRIREEKNK